ncbi:class I SAM-dependent methyltransferase [bacterium]|nr:class I SAM-dependent methyltransferase [bacterium]
MSFGEILGRFYCSMDRYERHYAASKFLRGKGIKRVLDVGGRGAIIKRFLSADITTINIDGSGDVEYDGKIMPFEDLSFPAVISLDTLEHVSEEMRQEFIKECLRVSSECVLISVPLGSKAHILKEKELSQRYTEVFGCEHTYLADHVEKGLPSLEQLEEYISSSGLECRMFFSGNFLKEGERMKRKLDLKEKGGMMSGLLRIFLKIGSLAVFQQFKLETQADDFTNRAYLFFDKTDSR